MKFKKPVLTAALLCMLNIGQNLFASHIVGCMITYTYMGPNQYLLNLVFHRDCAGIPPPTSAYICYSSASLNFNDTVLLSMVPGTGNEIFPASCFLPGSSSCQGGFNMGIQEWVYEGIVTLPQAANDWIFSFSHCCRSVNITTVQSTGQTEDYVYTILDNLNFPINSSPYFTLPFAQYCLNTLSTYSVTAADPDGDSLVYSLVAAQANTTFCPPSTYPLGYVPPWSPTYPLSSSTPVTFDQASGDFTFTPSVLEVGVIDVLMEEYRNGILIGRSKSDNMVFIVNGIPEPDFIKGKVYYDNNNNGIYDNGEPAATGSIVETVPGNYLTTSDIYGDYSVTTAPGFYTCTVPYPPLYTVTVPPFHTASFPSPFQTDSMNDFGLQLIPNIQDLRVILSGGNAIPPGSTTSMMLTYDNVGSVSIASGSVRLIYDANFIYDSSSVIPASISGDTLTWTFTNLSPLTSGNMVVYFSLPSSVPLNTALLSAAEILPLTGDTFPPDNFSDLNQVALIPVDPNYKTVNPPGPITTSQVVNGQYLEYSIHFQNTGIAPAINILITDTLDQNFNIPTFEVLSSSHNYTWQINGQGIIVFTFNNIMLPDSGTNELLSHGFIKYRIKPKNNLVLGDKMTNIAYIVFDSFAPLATNPTSTTVINMVSINQLSGDISDLIIYPNPTNGFLNIEMDVKQSGSLDFQFFNMMGKMVKHNESQVRAGSFKKQINLNDLSAGIYFLKITSSKKTCAAKIIKE